MNLKRKQVLQMTELDKDFFDHSLTRIYDASATIPVLMELTRLVRSYRDGDEPTKKWFDEIFTAYTEGQLETAIELLSVIVKHESCAIGNTFGVGDF